MNLISKMVNDEKIDMIATKSLFYISIFMIGYTYIGYPLLCLILSKKKWYPKIKNSDMCPNVSILISAYNEEAGIEKTIQNKLNQVYPKNKLEIIVISDGSTDKTEEIVKSFNTERVKLLRQEPRAGKTAALNLGIKQAAGHLIIFSDANSIYDENAISHLVGNFNDPQIGYASGKMIYVDSEGSIVGSGCSAYMKYENYIRRHETNLGSIVGVDGGIDAIRKELYRPMRNDQLPDFILPLRVTEQGYRVVYEPNAILKEDTNNSTEDEYKMRVRVALRAYWAIKDMFHLLNFNKYGIFSLQLFSHKILRYLCFIFLLTLFYTNVILLKEGFIYKISLSFQCILYGLSFLSMIAEVYNKRIKALYIFHYFVMINAAAAHAFIKFISNKKVVVWTPRK